MPGWLEGSSFYRKLAGFSALAPVLAGYLDFSLREPAKKSLSLTCTIVGVTLIFVLLGLAAAIVALFGVRKHGKEWILKPAIFGLCLNCLALLAMVAGVVAALLASQLQ